MKYCRLSSGRARLISGVLCAGFLVACSDDTADQVDQVDQADHADAAAEQAADRERDAGASKKANADTAAARADAGKPDESAAESGKGEQANNSAPASNSAKASAPASGKSAPDKPKAGTDTDQAKTKDSQPESLKVSVRFQAKLGKTDFACGHKYPSQGTANTTVTPRDLRLFVHGLELVKEDGSRVPVTLNPREPWQSDSLALLDFEDKTGRCTEGTEGTNTAITGTVAPGAYRGIHFSVGVPEALDHKDQAGASEPIKSAVGLEAKGPEGVRFAKISLQQLTADGQPTGGGLFELGSTQCTSAMASSEVTCARANRSEVELSGFDVEKSSIVIDLAALFSKLDLTQANECHSSEKSCAPMFDALGIDFTSGQPAHPPQPVQTLFRVQ